MRGISVLDHGYIELVDSSMAKDSICVAAARICYQSEADNGVKDESLITRLMSGQHGTPFEHAVMRWHVKCPLFVARQWMRHRMGSYNEKSLRYCTADREYYVPKSNGGQFRVRPNLYSELRMERYDGAEWIGADIDIEKYALQCEASFDTYNRLVDAGWPREQARGVLPMSVYTEFVWTVNARSLMNWLSQRLAKDAQWEHRQYAAEALAMWEERMPITAGAFIKHGGHVGKIEARRDV